MIAQSTLSILGDAIRVSEEAVEVLETGVLQSPLMDRLIWTAAFGNQEEKAAARWIIWEVGQQVGVRPASIYDFYVARGKGEVPATFTVPAINIRGMTYDVARSLFSKVVGLGVGAFVLELARSEMEYTDQSPSEYVTVLLAAALREGYRGPVFMQGDHFQAKAKAQGVAKEREEEGLRALIIQAVGAGMYNIDIDTSTLVDLTKEKASDQQRPNFSMCAGLSEHARSLEPMGITISLGGEIGEVGGHNSTEEELSAFMEGYEGARGGRFVGLSKLSVQTGTSHGGVVLPDGTIEQVAVDFETLKRLSKLAREEYSLAGAVQHGASTLPNELFGKFVEAGTLEIHLSTGFQNLTLDHPRFPAELLEKMYTWVDENLSGERKDGQTDEQFHYKLRKKAWGPFKKECWSIDKDARADMRGSLAERFGFLFEQLRVLNTKGLVESYVVPPVVHRKLSDFSQ